MKTKLKRRKGKGEFGFGAWEMESEKRLCDALLKGSIQKLFKEDIQFTVADSELEKLLYEVVEEGMEIVFREKYEVHVWMPWMWSVSADKLPRDPSLVVVELPFGSTEYDGPEFEFSLDKLVKDSIDTWRDGDMEKHRMEKIRDLFKLYVEELECELKRS